MRVWLHGFEHELDEQFLRSHPGGRDILLSASLLDDATPLFESYHSLSHIKGIRAAAKLLRVFPQRPQVLRASHPPPQYSYDDGGFYATLRERVRTHFHNRREAHKATWWWWFKAVAIGVSFFVHAHWVFTRDDFLIEATDLMTTVTNVTTATTTTTTTTTTNTVAAVSNALFAFVSGIILGVHYLSVAFIVLHDASHYAVSTLDAVNVGLSTASNAFILWNHSVWRSHHVAAHHSWTGEVTHDPDMKHARPLVRKHRAESDKKYARWALRLQEQLTWGWGAFVLAVLPGMFLGQVLTYLNALLSGRSHYFGAALDTANAYNRGMMGPYLGCVAVLIASVLRCPMVVLGWAVGSNLTYFACIAPDHDTFEAAVADHVDATADATPLVLEPKTEKTERTEKDDKVDKIDKGDQTQLPEQEEMKVEKDASQKEAVRLRRDWGELQARHSSNFATGSPLVCCFFGGINYQIEHHLFPGVSHVHYPALQPIVRETCREFGVPYHNPTWRAALVSWGKTISHGSSSAPESSTSCSASNTATSCSAVRGVG